MRGFIESVDVQLKPLVVKSTLLLNRLLRVCSTGLAAEPAHWLLTITQHGNHNSKTQVRARRSPSDTLVYLYLRKGPRSVRTHLRSVRALIQTTIYYTFATLAYGPPPSGRPWGRSGLPDLPMRSFGMPKSLQSGLNIKHFLLSQ